MITDESLMLDIDIIEKKHEEEIAKVIAEKDSALAEKDSEINSIILERDNAMAAMAAKDSEIAEKDSEITMLKAQLAALQKAL